MVRPSLFPMVLSLWCLTAVLMLSPPCRAADATFIPPENWIRAAEVLERAAPDAPEPHLMRLCAASLRDIAARPDYYLSGVSKAKPFLEELKTSVTLMFRSGETDPGRLCVRAFSIVECLAVVMREQCLGSSRCGPAQVALMRYFEQSGHWQPNDGSLVTEYYYHRIGPVRP